MKKTLVTAALAAALGSGVTYLATTSGDAPAPAMVTHTVTASTDCAFEVATNLTGAWREQPGTTRRTLLLTNRGEAAVHVRGRGIVYLACDLPTNQFFTAVRIYGGTNHGCYTTNFPAAGSNAIVNLLAVGPNYYAALVTDGTNDSAFSNELCITGAAPVLTIQRK